MRGVTSKQNLELAVQAFENSKADWESATAARSPSSDSSLITICGAIQGRCRRHPRSVGDYVSPQTLLTTVDENAELEAYIYIPTDRAGTSAWDCRWKSSPAAVS